MKFFKKYYSYLFLLTLFILISSCDEKNISLIDDSITSNEYSQQLFPLSLDKSILPLSPIYLNQDLSSRLYVGNIDDDLTSYAIFEIKSDLVGKYNICNGDELNEDIENIEGIFFRIVFDNPIYDNSIYSSLSDSLHFGLDTLYSNSNYSYGFEENIDNDINQESFYMKSYLSTNTNLVFNENESINHTPDYIINTIEAIKNEHNILPSSLNTAYKLDLDLTQYFVDDNADSFCSELSDKFYILVEYIPPNINYVENFEIISSDHYFMDFHPSIFLKYKQESIVDSLINKYDITDIVSESDDIPNILLLDNSELLDLEDLDATEFINDANENILWDINNLIVANVDKNSEGFGTFLGYRSGSASSVNIPIISVTTDSLNLFDVTIELDDTISSDSIIFYFSDITFGYQNINNLYDVGEEFDDYGTDQCPDSLETGNINICGSLSSESIYNPSGTENNGLYDEGEIWNDYGLDWLEGTSFYGVHDDYETGCKNEAYPYGIGYGFPGVSYKTYPQIISELGGIDFYKKDFILDDGTQIELCGQQFWSNPNQNEGVSSCPYCNLNDPNGDNKNIDPSNDDWQDVDGNLVGDYNENGIWDMYEPVELNGQWDWEDIDGDNIFTLGVDLSEPFFDFGIDQLPDNLESGNTTYDNYSGTNLAGTENNNNYDLGEIYYDTGFDNISTVQEDYYNRYGREGNDEVDIIDNGSIFKEFSDFGIDQCPNGFELPDNECGIINNENGDQHFDDINIDPNNDNYNLDNLEGTENNNSWDYSDINENSSYDDGEECESFNESQIPLNAVYLVGENLYNINLTNNESIYTYTKPLSLGVEDIILWISKIEKLDNDDYKISISISSSVDINAFQFKLNHIPYQESISYLETNTTQMYPLDFDDLNNNYRPDDGEINTELKYISDFSLYNIPDENSGFFDDEVVLSYGFGTKWNFYFDDLNDFIYSNDQSLFISEQQTNLVIHFNIESELHDISDEGVGLIFSGTIGDDILISDYIPSVLVFSDTEEISIQIGPLVNKLLSQSDNIFNSQSDVINSILSHIELSLNNYSNNFSKLVLDTNNLPYINILYSE